MSVKNLILWEKYRPKTMEDIVLLPRIRNKFKDGVKQHYIFHGSFGTGKTSLSRILIGANSNDVPYLELNCSYDTSIEVLRTKINDFCKTIPMMETKSDIKYVFLDEFERVSASFQDAFKAFIEKYNDNVIFIISTNHINKLMAGLKSSRFKVIGFDCENLEEEKYLKQEFYRRINNTILKNENKTIVKEHLVNIINKKFPDFRSILVEVQDYIDSGDVGSNSSNTSNKLKLDLFNILYESNIDYDKIYHFVMNNFGAEKVDVMLNLLGRPFVNWSIENSKNIDKLFKCNYVITDYQNRLDSEADPLILGMTVIGKFRDILN